VLPAHLAAVAVGACTARPSVAVAVTLEAGDL
jgi:hypothetical protein